MKKKRKEKLFFPFQWLSQPSEKKDFMKNNIFSVGFFPFFFFLLFLPHFITQRRTQDDEGFIFYTYRVVLRPRTSQINDTFNTGKDSVDSPSGCKVKNTDVQYICQWTRFASDFFFCSCYNSLLIDSQQLCVFIMWLFCIFMCEKNTQGPRQFDFQLENIWDI